MLFFKQGLEVWLLRRSSFFNQSGRNRLLTEIVQKGDSYLWHWFGYDDTVFKKGLLLKSNGQDLLAFSFGGPAHLRPFGFIFNGKLWMAFQW